MLTKEHVPWPSLLDLLEWNMLGWKIHQLEMQVAKQVEPHAVAIQPGVLNDSNCNLVKLQDVTCYGPWCGML